MIISFICFILSIGESQQYKEPYCRSRKNITNYLFCWLEKKQFFRRSCYRVRESLIKSEKMGSVPELLKTASTRISLRFPQMQG